MANKLIATFRHYLSKITYNRDRNAHTIPESAITFVTEDGTIRYGAYSKYKIASYTKEAGQNFYVDKIFKKSRVWLPMTEGDKALHPGWSCGVLSSQLLIHTMAKVTITRVPSHVVGVPDTVDVFVENHFKDVKITYSIDQELQLLIITVNTASDTVYLTSNVFDAIDPDRRQIDSSGIVKIRLDTFLNSLSNKNVIKFGIHSNIGIDNSHAVLKWTKSGWEVNKTGGIIVGNYGTLKIINGTVQAEMRPYEFPCGIPLYMSEVANILKSCAIHLSNKTGKSYKIYVRSYAYRNRRLPGVVNRNKIIKSIGWRIVYVPFRNRNDIQSLLLDLTNQSCKCKYLCKTVFKRDPTTQNIFRKRFMNYFDILISDDYSKTNFNAIQLRIRRHKTDKFILDIK